MLCVKTRCVLILAVLQLHSTLADKSVGCDALEDPIEEANTEPLDLLFNGVIKTYFDVKITSILSRTNNKFDQLYINATLEEVDDSINLVIFTTENFERYVKEQTEKQIYLSVEFECPGRTRTLIFAQPLKEGNYFPPEFSKDEYMIVIPTPLYKGFELTMFEEISATDDDLMGYEITFSSTDSEDSNIIVGTLQKHNEKTSFASLELMSILLSLNEKIEFSITAMDTGNPPRSSSPAKVIITADSSNSLPPIPRFFKAVVYGSLTEDLELQDLEIVLDPATYSADVSFRKLLDDDNIFQIKNVENVVYVTLTMALDPAVMNERDRLTFDVEASNKRLTESGRTAVSISFPQKKESHFKKEIYEGKLLVNSNTLEIEVFELLMDESKIQQLELDLQGQNANYFDLEHSQNAVELFLKPGLSADLWKNINFVSLKLVAMVNSEEIISTNIIIDVIRTILWFQKPAYIGSVSSDGNLVLEPIVLLTNTNTTDDVSIQLLQTDAKLFSFTRQNNQILLKFNENISDIGLSNKSYLSLEVEANELSTGVNASCFVLIEIPKVETESHFKKEMYEGKLLVNSNTLEIEVFELLIDESKIQQLELDLQGQNANYFDIEHSQNAVELFLKPGLSADLWKNINFVSLKLVAKVNSEEIISTNIIIDVIRTILWFQKPAYIGSVSSDGNLVLEPIVLLTNTNTTDDVSIQLLQTDAKLFSFTRQNNQILLKFNENISDIGLSNKSYLSLEVEANELSTGVNASCFVLIEIPKVETESHFKKEMYEGKLLVNSNTLEIEVFELLIDESKIQQLELDLQGQNANYFDIEHSQNAVELFLKPGLSADLWKNINFVSLKLVAKVNSEEIISTNIIIDVIRTILWFQKPAYIGSVRSDGNLVLEPIVLLTNTNTTDDVSIQLLQTDAELFSFIRQNNQILLKFNENISDIGLQNKSYLSLEVEANELSTGVNASCFVLIEIPKVETALTFEKSVYTAHIDDEAKLIAENVALDKDSYNNEIEFSLVGRDMEYFSFQNKENMITLSLKNNFNLSDHKDSNALWVELKALSPKEKLEASAIVVVDVFHDVVPEFEQPNYIGELNQGNLLSIEKIALKMSTWKNYTLIELQGDYSEFFQYTVLKNQIEISLKSELPEESKDRSSIVLVIIAGNNDLKGYSTAVINLPQSRNLSKIFRKTIQNGKILEDGNTQVLKIDDIEFARDFTVAEFTCNLSGDEYQSFDYTVVAPKNVIKLVLAAELPNDIVQLNFYITLLLECQNKDDASISGSTIIFLNLPGNNGQKDCPTQEPPAFIPEFQNNYYNLFAKPTYVGSLQSVRATIKGSDDGIRYSLQVKNEHLRSRLNIDSTSGEIALSAITSPGRYYFNIIAENIVTHSQSQAEGRLDVEAIIQCEDHASVSNSLLVKYLQEEMVHDAILNGKYENCEFYVFSMEPDNKEYVQIDPSTKMLTMILTDREDAVFANMVVPQIEVKLKLDCSNAKTIRRRGDLKFLRRSERDLMDPKPFAENRSLILTNDIVFAKDVTILTIILEDINDNRPEFVFPKQERLLVGFPEEEISMQIFSEHLIQVVARDKDEGLNSKIRYSIQPNQHFQIDPNSGEVYPYENAMKGINEVQLIVYATDRDGANDGLSSKFTIVVKVLTAKHFTLLTFVNENVKSIDALMNSARNKTGINFVALKHATVPTSGKTTIEDIPMPRAGTVQFVQKVWTYSFEGDIPVLSSDIKRKLSEGPNDMNIFAQTFEEVVPSSEEVEFTGVQNLTGYIAGLCVLAVIIITCIGFILWKYIYQNHSQTHREPGNNLSSRGPTNQNFNLKQGAEIDIQKQTEILSDALYEPSFYSKRESVKILGTTTQESTDDGKRRQIEKLNSNLNGSLAENYDGTESDSSNESMRPRATVTFNELVERIHIDSDDEEKNKSR